MRIDLGEKDDTILKVEVVLVTLGIECDSCRDCYSVIESSDQPSQ